MVKVLNVDNFKNEVENYKGVCLVDFYADWCGPCKMMSPIIDEIAEEISTVNVGKVNVDDNIPLAEKFGIMSIPAIFVFKDGQVSKSFVGVTSKEELIKAIND